MEPTTNNIRKEISVLQEKLKQLEEEEATAELLMKKRAFLKEHLTSLNLLVGQMEVKDIANKCHNTQIGDFLKEISECLGYQIAVPTELESKTITYVLCALDLIHNDERFRV